MIMEMGLDLTIIKETGETIERFLQEFFKLGWQPTGTPPCGIKKTYKSETGELLEVIFNAHSSFVVNCQSKSAFVLRSEELRLLADFQDSMENIIYKIADNFNSKIQ
jgi:hypothetical protein